MTETRADVLRRHTHKPLLRQTCLDEQCDHWIFDPPWYLRRLRCSRKATQSLGGRQFCTQHYKMVRADLEKTDVHHEHGEERDV